MFIFFIFFFILCHSQCLIDSTVNNITTISYNENSNCSSLILNRTYPAVTLLHIFESSTTFYNEELIVYLLNYPGHIHGETISYFGEFNYSAPNLQIIRIKPSNIIYQFIKTNYINSYTHFYIGCFGDDINCEQPSYYFLYVYSISYTIFMEEGAPDFNTLEYLSDNSMDPNGYPYVFVGSTSTFSLFAKILINNEKFNYDYCKSLSGSFYLLTSYNIDFSFQSYTDYTVSSSTIYYDFNTESVCSRKNTTRYVLFHEDHAPYTNCSCWTKNNVTEMNQSTIFNYPDCIFNSTMFDLILPNSSSIYLLSDDLLDWYSIIFTTSNQLIQINEGKTLTIDELDINQEDVSFNENVYVKNLTISTIGASFNNINFDNINYLTTSVDDVLFTIQSTSINFKLFGLEQINNDIMVKLCIYVGSIYFDRDNNEMNDCSNFKLSDENNVNLLIESIEYSITSNEYWKILKIGENELLLNGTSTLSSTLCEFEDKIITINCDLYCKTMNINLNTKLIVNGELSIDVLVINDEMNDNLNENGIIESYGSTEIMKIEITKTQSNCVELISSNDSLSQPLINSDYSILLLLSQNHLLRICPSLNTNYEVQCTTFGNTFGQQSFDLLHCPCIDSNCTINVNSTQLDSRNIDFNGTFNILTNCLIDISNKTTIFSLQNINNKNVILTDESEVGMSVLNLEFYSNLKQIEISSTHLCKLFMLKGNEIKCLNCNASYNYNGYCTDTLGIINNCFNQTEVNCEVCYEGYESKVLYCKECPSNCLRCYNGECINCEMNYQLNETKQCELITDDLIEIFSNNKIMKCNDGYYSNTNQCIKCLDNNCITCNSSQCLTCNNNNYTLNNGNCQSKELNNGEEIISNYGVIDCNNGYYSNNSQCIDCSLTFDNCELCNINGCLSCSNGVIINNGSCSLNTNCLNIDYSICLSCNDGSWFNGNECIECEDNCKNCINGYCIECNDGYILQNENNCVGASEYPDNCITLSYYGTCQRCSDGYYLNNTLCYECSNECTSCHNLTYCFGCNDGYMLNNNNECELMISCKIGIPGSSGGCAICNNGYYRNQTLCSSCISNCTKCNNGKSCLICESNFFLLNDASECISYDDLTNCETPTQNGCTKCNDSYYLNKQYCILCSNTIENCNTCNNNGECLTCQNDYVLINYKCIYYQLIDNCKESSDSKCSSCSFWHTLNSDQTRCDTQVVWWVIVLIIIVILIIMISIFVLILYVIKLLLDWRKHQKQRKQTTIFDMKTSNIQFESTNNKDVVINTNELLFNDESDEIEVNKETRDLICVGNTSKHTIKVQFSVKDGCDKYEIRTNPQLITIQKGKACEFEIFIKPLCTCSINDQIMLISVDLTKGKTIITPITINTITIMTSHLDYSELIEDVKLGEGSFGIVYKGTFRGNQVAIKKLKNSNNNPESIEEFNKEVAMLDKFRNDYIVHFYGAVFIPTKICMVTEFAQYGSLQDLMNKTKDNPIDNTMKLKILLDCSKGISYLHSNGILHRDIKPDNILVLSLDTNVEVNSKLTDFGSSRNINMLMTNMTFTNGIGTPVYMAPEVLQQNKYKKSADIYSFAITIYETMIWNEAYSKDKFKFPWKIAKFVNNGNRLEQQEVISDKDYSLIKNCWKQEPKERYTIEEVVKELEVQWEDLNK